jgi:hypothetical protein
MTCANLALLSLDAQFGVNLKVDFLVFIVLVDGQNQKQIGKSEGG